MHTLPNIDFSCNWNNKLNCKAFTTIRLFNAKTKVGNSYNIRLKGEVIKTAIVRDIKTFRLPQLTEYMAYLDTGYSKIETTGIITKIYQSRFADVEAQTFMFILLETETPPPAAVPQAELVTVTEKTTILY